jgi:hypothetical protein
VTTLGPTKRLRFVGGDNIAVSAENNSTLGCVDITIAESATPINTPELGSFSKLRFLGTSPITVSAANNSTLNCVDITIDGESAPSALPTSISINLDFTGSSYMEAGFTLWSYNTDTPEYPSGGPPFVASIDWGDGSIMDHFLSNEYGEVYFSHTYSAQIAYTVTLWCTDWSLISDFYIYESWLGIDTHNVTNPFPWASLIIMKDSLLYFYLADCTMLTEIIPVNTFNQFTKLETLWISDCGFSGTIPDITNCTELYRLSLYNNNFSNVVAGSFATQPHCWVISLKGNALTQNAVDQILKDLVTALSLPGALNYRFVYLNEGTNSPPSEVGQGYKNILDAAGWSIYTN